MAAEAAGLKHPTVAVGRSGDVLIAWVEGASFSRGGSLGWRVIDAGGRVMASASEAASVPKWSLASAVARPDGSFTIVY